MPTLLQGLSHAVLYFNTVEGSKQTGIGAMMKLCFGSDDDAISQILYSSKDGSKTLVWTLPVRISREGIVTTTPFPIFTGRVGEELLAAVARTADRFKKANVAGKLAGRAFRITKTSIDEIKDEKTTQAK